MDFTVAYGQEGDGRSKRVLAAVLRIGVLKPDQKIGNAGDAQGVIRTQGRGEILALVF